MEEEARERVDARDRIEIARDTISERVDARDREEARDRDEMRMRPEPRWEASCRADNIWLTCRTSFAVTSEIFRILRISCCEIPLSSRV